MLHFIIILLILIALSFLLWTQSIRPNKITDERRKLVKPFEDVYIAHRGLFNNRGKHKGEAPEAPENSLKAFQLAIEHGYGMEMDVQLTKDDKLVVFHDGNLKRMCGINRPVLDFTYQELKEISLRGSDQHIPLFSQVRDLVAGRSPMIIEIKPEGDCRKTARFLNEHMKDYQGVYCVESFDPRAVKWYRDNRPDVMRGQLSERFPKEGFWQRKFVRKMCTNLLFNFYARPDFIAYNHKHKDQISYRLLRKLYPVFNVAWTIRSQEQLEKARETFSVFIFDSFIPDSDRESDDKDLMW